MAEKKELLGLARLAVSRWRKETSKDANSLRSRYAKRKVYGLYKYLGAENRWQLRSARLSYNGALGELQIEVDKDMGFNHPDDWWRIWKDIKEARTNKPLLGDLTRLVVPGDGVCQTYEIRLITIEDVIKEA